ncbi:TPA: hypothetical protein DCW54_02740 [Candidatus Dependentiae bacterium]|nr:hypothetical protein [Candidatus Dependentiae bacterium]
MLKKPRIKLLGYASASLLLALFFSPIYATHIQSFHSDIIIHQSGELEVTNNIEYVETRYGKHGIYHSIPVAYSGPLGTNYTTKLSVKTITRNGQSVPFKQTFNNGRITFLIGSAEIIIPPGTYQYVIHYTTQRQLQFYEEYDELAWNVTGLESALPIYHASATIKLPKNIPAQSIKASAFTGPYQSDQRNALIEQTNSHILTFATTHLLKPFEGLTIYVSWKRGLITRPSTIQEVWLFAKDNPGLLLFFLLYLLLIWYLVLTIRQIRAYENYGTIIPRFYPPKDTTPAECGYLKQRHIAPTHVAAQIVDLAIRGYLTISASPPDKTANQYTIKKTDQPWATGLNTLESAFLTKLFSAGEEYRIHKNPLEKERKQAAGLIKTLQKAVEERPFSKLLKLHVSFIIPVLGTTVAAILLCSLLDGYVSPLFLIPGGILISIAACYLPGYTPEGRVVRDEIDGFALYLKTAEIDRLKIIGTPPIRTPALFEKYLPFAMALGLEEAWTKQFAPLFKEWETSQNPYRPTWFIGNHFSPIMLTNFTRLYAATTNPTPTYGSSKSPTGRFGGGFSGGGRGGGGTGSW